MTWQELTASLGELSEATAQSLCKAIKDGFETRKNFVVTGQIYSCLLEEDSPNERLLSHQNGQNK